MWSIKLRFEFQTVVRRTQNTFKQVENAKPEKTFLLSNCCRDTHTEESNDKAESWNAQ